MSEVAQFLIDVLSGKTVTTFNGEAVYKQPENEFNPDYVVRTSTHIKDYMQFNNIDREGLATKTFFQESYINDILDSHIPLDKSTCAILDKELNAPKGYFMRMENFYRGRIKENPNLKEC